MHFTVERCIFAYLLGISIFNWITKKVNSMRYCRWMLYKLFKYSNKCNLNQIPNGVCHMTSLENDGRPPTPSEKDCCGNGCNPCIFDIHKKLLEEWEKNKLKRLNLLSDKNYLSVIKYNRFIVKDIQKASEDSILVEVNIGSDDESDILSLNPAQHVIMKLTSVSKPYTPISWDYQTMKLLIKLYPNGTASSYIRQLNINDEVFIRGPYGEFKYLQNSYANILMFSIGSGIAAVYPLAASIVKDELEESRINMMLGFQSTAHLPLKKELRLLTDYWNFECTLYLSQKNSMDITGLTIVNSRLDEKIIIEKLDLYSSETTLILICGTSEFNDTLEKIVNQKQFLHYHVFR